MTHEGQFLIEARSKYERALRAAGNGSSPSQYWIDPNFTAEYDAWDQKDLHKGFRLGSVSTPLQSIGIDDKKIYPDGAKIIKIKKKHPEMTDSIIKSIPSILERPIMMLQSKTRINRVVVFGEGFDDAGNPVMVALELRPAAHGNAVSNFIKIASAYKKERGNPLQRLVDESDLLYLDPNKKRTEHWLHRLRLQLPPGVTKFGSINNVTYANQDVNGKISFEPRENTYMREVLEKAEEQRKKEKESVSKENKSLRVPPQKGGMFDPSLDTVSVTEPTKTVKSQFSIFPQGENPVRDIEIDSKTEHGKTMRFARTAAESSVTDDFAGRIQEEVKNGTFSYEPITDIAVSQRVDEKINSSDPIALLSALEERVTGDSMSKDDVVLGEKLIRLFVEAGDSENAMKATVLTAEIGKKAGQVVQAMRMMKKMTPEGQLYAVQRVVERINRLYEKFKESEILLTQTKLKTFAFKGVEYQFTPKERTEYLKRLGGHRARVIDELIQSPEYRKSADEDKAYMIKKAYDFAAEVAKGEIAPSLNLSYDTTKWVSAAKKAGAVNYIRFASGIRGIEGDDKIGEKLSILSDLNLPKESQIAILETEFDGKEKKHSEVVKRDIPLSVYAGYVKYRNSDRIPKVKNGRRQLPKGSFRYLQSLDLTAKQKEFLWRMDYKK